MKALHPLTVVVAAGMLACGPRAQPELHLLPAGYVGQVYIVFGVAAAAETPVEGGRRVYQIPASGILLTHSAANPGWSLKSETQMEYVDNHGHRTPISGRWYSTIADTPDARRDPTVGVIGMGLGKATVPRLKCEVEFQEYFVGRQSDILANRGRDDDGAERMCSAATSH